MGQGALGTAGLKVGLSFGFKTKGTFCQSGRHRAGASGRGMYKRPRLRQPRRRPGRVLRELRFGVSSLPLRPIFRTVSTKHTHTHTLRQHSFWPWLPPGRQKYVGGGDRRWRPDCGLRGCHPLPVGRPGPVFTFQCGPIEWGGRLPRPGRPGRGAPEVPCARPVSAKEPGQRPLLGGDPSPALRWLPAAVYPATAGPPGLGAREGAKIRVRTGLPGWVAHRRGRLSPQRTLQLGEPARPASALRSRPAARNQEPPPRLPQALRLSRAPRVRV